MVCADCAFGQNLMLLTSRQGLSNSCVRNIYEDQRHNVWITTMNGLNRYDGVKLNVYRHDDSDPHSLAHDESTCVLDYEPGHVIVGTMNGAQVYDYATDKFSDIPFVYMNGDTIHPRIVTIANVRDMGYVVCAAGYGCALIEKSAGGLVAKWTSALDTGEGKEMMSPVQLLEDRNGNLWIVNGGRQVYRRQGGCKGRTYSYDDLAELKITNYKLHIGDRVS